MEWTDPNDGLTYELMYNVTQTEDEGPEHAMYRWKGSNEWTKLPPFALDHDVARKFADEVFGPLHGWQHGIPGSIVSDIERIDQALDILADHGVGGDGDLNAVLDALHDARSGLLYLSNKLNPEVDADETSTSRHYDEPDAS